MIMTQLRQAARQLWKTPGFTILAIVTLALGAGVNTAMFSVIEAVMLRPLPYPHPEQLVRFAETTAGANYVSFSLADLPDYLHNTTLSGIVHIGDDSLNLTGVGAPERVPVTRTSGNFFDILDVHPRFGRGYSPSDDRLGAPHVVVLGDEFWRSHFGADPNIVGKSIRLDGEPYLVTGVMPPGFVSPEQFGRTDRLEMYVPDCYGPDVLNDRGTRIYTGFARLRPGVSVAQARSELNGIAARLAQTYPKTNKGDRVVIEPLKDNVAAGSRTSLLVLLGAVSLILLIACVNVANLLLARAVRQRRDIAVRIALGAKRTRIMRELLIQNGMLALAGCVLGILCAGWMTTALIGSAPDVPRLGTATLNLSVLAFGLLACGGTAMLFGLAPAWLVSGADPQIALHGSNGRHSAGSGVLRWRAILMASEVALSLVLLVGAGLMLKSFITLRGVNLGFEPDRVLAMNISIPDPKAGFSGGNVHRDNETTPVPELAPGAEHRYQFFDTLTRRVEAIPGVEAAAFGRFPLRGHWSSSYEQKEHPVAKDEDSDIQLDSQICSVNYFRTLQMRVVEGRDFRSSDRVGAEPVVVVNQAFERRYYPHGAIGHEIRRTGASQWRRIIGVVADAHYYGQDKATEPSAFMPAAQLDSYPIPIADFAVRSSLPPAQLLPAIRKAVWGLDPDQPITRIQTLSEKVSESQSRQRFQTMLLGLFGVLALVLAVVGIYGVVSYTVEQRTSEIGLRMALGARPAGILGMVIRQAMTLCGAGALAGLAIAWAASRAMSSLLFGVQPVDAITYAAVCATLIAAALAACWLPAYRAAGTNPMEALRHE
jgi:putative ABC transport system permease protein